MILIEGIVVFFLVLGAIFALVGSYGLLKLDNTMARLHAPTKASTLGVGSMLIASMVYGFGIQRTIEWHELLVTLFLILTAPISANFMAKAYMHRKRLEPDLPATGVNRRWATFEPDSDAPPPQG